MNKMIEEVLVFGFWAFGGSPQKLPMRKERARARRVEKIQTPHTSRVRVEWRVENGAESGVFNGCPKIVTCLGTPKKPLPT